MKFSFIIPAYKNYSGLHQLLFDIYKNCSKVHEVLIMDDKSNDQETLNGLAWWTSNGMLPIQHVRNVENLGFLKNSNKGLKMATGDILCLISTDVRIHQDLVSYSFKSLHTEDWEKKDKDEEFYKASFLGGRFIDFDSGWNTFDKTTYPYLEGWLLCGYQKDWKIIGYFDERYSPNDFEDVDFSTKALLWNWELMVYPDGYVEHGGAHSIGYNAEREELTKLNQKKFQKKWINK